MSVADRLNKLTTDITNAYASIDNKVKKILPEGYTRVEYIESTGTQYIDTGYKINNNCSAKYKYEYISGNALSGVYNVNQDLYFGIVRPSTGKLSYRYSTEFYEGNIPSTNTIYNVEVSLKKGNQYLKVNNVVEQTSQNNDNFSNNLNCHIFNINNLGGVTKISAKLYYFKIYDNDVLVRDYIPCYRNSDNEIGLYDIVNNQFYANAGTGTFLKGSNTATGLTKNTNNLSTAIDSIEVIEQQTAEGESLNLTNTKAMPYSDYVVEGKSEQEGKPSPSIPSEIHSVADDVNLFDASKIANSIISVTDNGKTIKLPIASSGNGNVNTSAFLKDLCPKLNVGDVVYLNFTRNINPNTNNFIYLYNSSASPSSVEWGNGTSKTITQDLLDSYMILYGNRAQDGETQQIIITDFKIQKNKITPYSPYNQGTVTIKQRGKNKFDGTILSTNNATYSNGIVTQTTADTASNIVWKFNAFNNSSFVRQLNTQTKSNTGILDFTFIKDNTFNVLLFGLNGSARDTTIRISLADLIDDETYTLSFNVTNVTQGSISWKDIMIEHNLTYTSYEPYQTPHDYTFQTEPLRSLPNGVKDTIEADGIHRRVGRVVLDGTENWDNYSLVYGSTEIVQCRLMLSSNYKSRVGLSDRFLVIADYSATEHIVISGGLNAVFIHINKSRLSTEDITGFKNWLSNNYIELLYELATEIIEPLTQNQANTMLDIIKTGSYEGATNICTDEDVKPTIGVGYYKKG